MTANAVQNFNVGRARVNADSLHALATILVGLESFTEGKKYILTNVETFDVMGNHYLRSGRHFDTHGYGLSIIREGDGKDHIRLRGGDELIGQHIITVVCMLEGECRVWIGNDENSYIELNIHDTTVRFSELAYRGVESTKTLGQRIDGWITRIVG